MKITLSSPGLHHLMWLYPDERTREKRAGECAPVSKSELSRIPCGAQWEPSRKASLPLPHLQDVLWGNARDAHVWVEDPCRGGAPALLIVMRRGSWRGAEEITGHKYETSSLWLKRAATHAAALTQVLASDLHLSQVEIDEFWSFVQKKTAQRGSLTRENAGDASSRIGTVASWWPAPPVR